MAEPRVIPGMAR